jgi:hypothetical protein
MNAFGNLLSSSFDPMLSALLAGSPRSSPLVGFLHDYITDHSSNRGIKFQENM